MAREVEIIVVIPGSEVGTSTIITSSIVTARSVTASEIQMWQSQVENKLIISRMINQDFLCPFMND